MYVSHISKIKYWKELAMQKEDYGIPQPGMDYKPLGKDAGIFKQKRIGRISYRSVTKKSTVQIAHGRIKEKGITVTYSTNNTLCRRQQQNILTCSCTEQHISV